MGRAWDVFQPLLFGLIGAEIRLSKLDGHTVGEKHSHIGEIPVGEISIFHCQGKSKVIEVSV